jgi:hypothetical protein
MPLQFLASSNYLMISLEPMPQATIPAPNQLRKDSSMGA